MLTRIGNFWLLLCEKVGFQVEDGQDLFGASIVLVMILSVVILLLGLVVVSIISEPIITLLVLAGITLFLMIPYSAYKVIKAKNTLDSLK